MSLFSFFEQRLEPTVATAEAAPPSGLMAFYWHYVRQVRGLLVARPIALLFQNLVTNQAIAPGLTNLIRWQSHWHVVRQSWTFFQNDFAGRIANRIMQTVPALRESVVALLTAVWYILVYGGSAMVLMGSNDLRLAIPVMLW